MKKISYRESGFDAALAALADRPGYPPEIEQGVRAILDAVRAEGDVALFRYAREFDHVALTAATVRVLPSEFAEAEKLVADADKQAIETALAHVQEFARRRIPQNWTFSPRAGVTLGEKFSPMRRVGVYIPGGTAPLVSTVIHTAGIAAAAGVPEIVGCTPARKDGTVHPAVLCAMARAGVTEVYKLGGVYAIGAMAYGTASVRRVDKIVGPGNAYVTAAKKLVYGKVGIDMVAGPSEVMIIADGTNDPEYIAADFLSQAEHGSGLEQAVLVSTDEALLERVAAAVERQKTRLPRLATVDKVLDRGAFLILAESPEQAAGIASEYAPEHLEIMCENAEEVAARVTAAGAIFLGENTPEPAGDFCAGPSHVLPTAGSAKFFSGLTVEAFFRRSSIVRYTADAIQKEIPVIEAFGGMEGLAAHAASGTRRRK